jgi:glycerol kinase
VEQVASNWRERARYEPAMSADHRESLLNDWGRALARAKGWERA